MLQEQGTENKMAKEHRNQNPVQSLICNYSPSQLALKHILVECRQPYLANSLHKLFGNVSQEVILQFIRVIGFYHEI